MTRLSALCASTALVCALALGAPIAFAAGSSSMGPSATPEAQRTDPAAAYQAGVAALNARDYQSAINHFRDARRGSPRDGAINYGLGLAYSGAGNQADAKASFERAVRADNAPAGAWLQLGLTNLQLGDRAGAEAQQTALQQRIAACDAACGDTRRAQYQAALEQLTAALASPAPASADPATTGWNFPSVEEGRLAYAEAVGLINQERYVEAFASLQRAEAAVGPHPDVLNYMGFTSRKLGDFDAALRYYSAALAIEPNHLGATEYLGELYVQMGQLDRARSQLAQLDQLCAYGCPQREELARWIDAAE